MALESWFDRSGAITGAPGVCGRIVNDEEWRRAAEDLAAAGARLLALWAHRDADGRHWVRALYGAQSAALVLSLPLPDEQRHYPGIERGFSIAGRMQRAVADLNGLRSTEGDARPWLRHAAWPESFHPLDCDGAPAPSSASVVEDYAFVRVGGDGVHEIPVGPVHAGIIEPGHFRFSVVGEKVLRLEERLGYVHKGIERRFTEMTLSDGHRLAARVSGDSAVAFSWAYCQALEGMAETQPPVRALWLRALALELERLANHLGDIGALGNDAGFALGLAQFSRLKEQLLRANEQAFGQRYLMDFVLPGGTRLDLSSQGAGLLLDCVRSIRAEIETLRKIYEDHAGLRDRFVGAGIVTPILARAMGLCGFAGRASGQAFDLRCDLPCEPYRELEPRKSVRTGGDVAARVEVRFDEVAECVRLTERILSELPGGSHAAGIPIPNEGAFGIGMIEGWRGPVVVAIDAGADGTIRRCHPHDPSWQNWPVIEHAVIDNIVPDFPLINKSFNPSYSGHDL